MRNTHKKKEIKLGDLSCPFSDANAPVLFVMRVCFTWRAQLKSKRPRLPNQFPDSWFWVSLDAINFLGIWGRLYNSFGFYCGETHLSIQFSIHLEWQSQSSVFGSALLNPATSFLLTICYIYYAWSPLPILKGVLRGLAQMLRNEILTAKRNFLALFAQLIFWNAIQRLKIE